AFRASSAGSSASCSHARVSSAKSSGTSQLTPKECHPNLVQKPRLTNARSVLETRQEDLLCGRTRRWRQLCYSWLRVRKTKSNIRRSLRQPPRRNGSSRNRMTPDVKISEGLGQMPILNAARV